MSFGRMPIANGFLKKPDFPTEFFFELKVGHCPSCHMVQLTELVDPSKLFHENYAYFSSISTRMANHFRDFAADVKARYLPSPDPLVAEIGSNDGIMLKHFASDGIRHVGIEPSANVAKAAMDQGIRTVVRFFDEQAGIDLAREYGQADAFLGANVICHVPDIHSVIRGILHFLKDDGVFIFQEPYLGDILEKTSYDQIYDEHYFYFSLTSLESLFSPYEMEIVDISHQNVHGGSMRYVVARKGRREVSQAVRKQMRRETDLGMQKPEAYDNLKKNIMTSRDELVALLKRLKSSGKRVTGYGATSKSTTVTNFCGIGPDLIEFISDTTPGKQGTWSPGAHIPVVPYQRFQERYPDYALLFAWNHGEEIMEKEAAFKKAGGRFIVYVPKVKIAE